jgi:hypothetical protein
MDWIFAFVWDREREREGGGVADMSFGAGVKELFHNVIPKRNPLEAQPNVDGQYGT